LLQATRTVPIVFATVGDPVGADFVDSLARPGGNATGSLEFSLFMAMLREASHHLRVAEPLGCGPSKCRAT
jgi:putative ABC transport system substrate-binding protein